MKAEQGLEKFDSRLELIVSPQIVSELSALRSSIGSMPNIVELADKMRRFVFRLLPKSIDQLSGR